MQITSQPVQTPAAHEPVILTPQPLFDEGKVLHDLKHYLPSQTPIKDFIHHNTLHAFQHMKFYDAIFNASSIFGYQVTLGLEDYRKLYATGRIRKETLATVIVRSKDPGNIDDWTFKLLKGKYDTHTEPRIGKLRALWKKHYRFDLETAVQPLLFRIICSYLDQGIALWKFPLSTGGFIESVRQLEKHSHTSFFKSHRARQLLLENNIDLKLLLRLLVGDEAYFEQYLFDQQFSHQGWSGIVSAVEDAPHTLLDKRAITLKEFIIFELLLEIDNLDNQFGTSWEPLSTYVSGRPANLFAKTERTELQDVLILWQNAFEWTYYDEVLAGMQVAAMKKTSTQIDKSFQAIFCIDERECSLRRHIEAMDPKAETLGSPGFFGAEFYFQPYGGKFYEKLCPAPVTPMYLIKETEVHDERKHELLYTAHAQSLFRGLLSTLTLGLMAAVRMVQNLFFPKMSPAISDATAHMNKRSVLTIENKDINDRESGLQIGFTVDEMAIRVEGLLRGIGLINDFAPLVYSIAHGSSSANNPHHSAHDCGACSGRPGSVNARVFAHMANHPDVRKILKQNGINIPATTQFIGGMHDTAADRIEFYDEHLLPETIAAQHKENVVKMERALDWNAKERSRRFASINTMNKPGKVRKDILKRSVSMFEPRPELGHGTNSLCIVGRRELTRNLFLDRRAFLNSYDYRQDPDGKFLTGVMRPIGLVCGGINLEYYFSRVDNYRLGAGTKLPHNVMGLVGVANSSDGDLRPGLPLQMIEVHDPVRLLVIVEHEPEIVLKAVSSAPEILEWYQNEWVHLVALQPSTGQFHYFRNGAFDLYEPGKVKVDSIRDLESFFGNAKEMETNYIVDATRENLPVHTIN